MVLNQKPHTHTTLVLDQNPREVPSRSMMASSINLASFDLSWLH